MPALEGSSGAPGSPVVRLHPNPRAFLEVVGEDLEADEATHSLLLGLALAAERNVGASQPPPLLATVHEGGAWSLAVLMTPGFPLLLTGAGRGSGAAIEELIRWLRKGEREVRGVDAQVDLAAAFATEWSRASGQPVRIALRHRLHRLTRVEPVAAAAGRLRRATLDDLELVQAWVHAFQREAVGELERTDSREIAAARVRAGELYLWEDQEPRSMAGRCRPTRTTISINAVYTPPEHRGRGYATAAVARLSSELLEEGYRSCVLFTDLANPTSNRIYRRIGYDPIGDYDVHLFG